MLKSTHEKDEVDGGMGEVKVSPFEAEMESKTKTIRKGRGSTNSYIEFYKEQFRLLAE